ncbi:hypothetical protein [Polyangium jinanense]|uniref:DUF3617 family protein n=1 Tax=Polyangium jinanense TaxID=2829994 RepID=A0A9X4AQ07_9BACT|nr:hypothetical protein [Polyangium jinanense]MDC3980599.1 hypothetical protein [Polyangium jinanense]
MLKHIAAAALVSTFALGATAFAETGAGQNAGLKQLSWQQLQSACQNPAAFQSQRQPNAIRLTCEDTQLVWEAEQTDRVEMDNSRQITASLSSDKYYVIRQDQSVENGISQTMCPRFREVQVSHTQSFSLSCQEIQNFQGNMNDFCKARLDTAVKGNQQLATRTATGRVYDMCAAPALVNEPPKAPAAPVAPVQNGGKAQPGGAQPSQPGGAQPSQPGGMQPSLPGGQIGGVRPSIGGQLPRLPGLAGGNKSR